MGHCCNTQRSINYIKYLTSPNSSTSSYCISLHTVISWVEIATQTVHSDAEFILMPTLVMPTLASPHSLPSPGQPHHTASHDPVISCFPPALVLGSLRAVNQCALRGPPRLVRGRHGCSSVSSLCHAWVSAGLIDGPCPSVTTLAPCMTGFQPLQ